MLESTVKIYRIEYVGGIPVALMMTVLALSIVGLPIALIIFPTMYRLVTYR
jgi:hypothetical protein